MENSVKTKNRAARTLLKSLIPQILIQSIAIIATASISYFFMNLMIREIIEVQNTYLAAIYEILGTLVLMIIALVSTNTYVYRKRLQEINTLSKAISSVAAGDFNYRIPIKKDEPLTPVYKDFNKMSAELESVPILRNDFINNYSHEFKTPIASINGFAELLLKKSLPEEERKQYLEIIRDESERLSALAKNTILLSKLSTQQIVTDMESYNLGEQLRQCAIICSNDWMEKKQDFTGDFDDVQFYGNRELLQHLWINLIANAVRYTKEGGSISASLKKDNDKAVVVVKDTGVGMSEDTLKYLFNPYYQGDSSRATQGLGLGLSIAQRIVVLCNGEISVTSELGKGSEFTVKLPIKMNNEE